MEILCKDIEGASDRLWNKANLHPAISNHLASFLWCTMFLVLREQSRGKESFGILRSVCVRFEKAATLRDHCTYPYS